MRVVRLPYEVPPGGKITACFVCGELPTIKFHIESYEIGELADFKPGSWVFNLAAIAKWFGTCSEHAGHAELLNLTKSSEPADETDDLPYDYDYDYGR